MVDRRPPAGPKLLVSSLTGALLGLLIALPALPADTFSWTLSEALDAARASDPALERARISLVETLGENEAGWNLFLPDLQVGTSLSRSMFDQGGSPWTSSVSASASLGLSPGTATRLRRRSLDHEIARIAWLRRDVELRQSVRERFYRVLLAEERLSIALRNATLAQQQFEQVEALFEEGRASQLDLLEARAAAIRGRPDVLSRREALASDRSRLKEIAGLSPDDQIALSGSIEIPQESIVSELDPEMITSFVLSESLEIEAARLELDRQRATQSLVTGDTRRPRLSASYSYSPSFSPPFSSSEWGDGESWETGSLSFRLTMPVDPLIPRSRGDNEIRAARFDTEREALRFQETETSVRRRAAELAGSLAFSTERLSILEEATEIARGRYTRILSVFESGGVDLLDVENARGSLEDSEVDLLQERFNIVAIILEIDALAGGALLSE
jgi:outer membrane protein TolC